MLQMAQFPAARLPETAGAYSREILSCTTEQLLALSLAEAGGELLPELRQDALSEKTAGAPLVLILGPYAAISPDTWKRLVAQPERAVLTSGRLPLAFYGPAEEVLALSPQTLPEGWPVVQCEMGESLAADSAEGAYAVQEQLRRRINFGWMQKGVFLADPNTTHISPNAALEPGCTILPGCLIYGTSTVAEGAVIGPNTLLRDAHIGRDCKVNASQVNESTVGAGTTVGPFAYIRPGCTIGEKARIGDFVELKNSTVGDGTKVSHLTYIGDSDLGSRINVGCGVVTVNYDGKKKYRTTVEDGSFVGCNVNLVSPVRIGKGSYLAAGGTITEDVPEDALVIARSRQTVKPGWARKRREEGKL